MKPYKSVSIRVPVDLHEQFTATCRDMNRSFNAYVIEAMQDICKRVKEHGAALEGTQMKLVNTDYSALEKRIMAHMDQHFDRVEKKMDNPVYHVQMPELSASCNVDIDAVQRMMGDMQTNTARGPASIKLDTSGFTAADLEEFQKQFADGGLCTFEPGRDMPLILDGCTTRARAWARGKADLPAGDIYAAEAEQIHTAAVGAGLDVAPWKNLNLKDLHAALEDTRLELENLGCHGCTELCSACRGTDRARAQAFKEQMSAIQFVVSSRRPSPRKVYGIFAPPGLIAEQAEKLAQGIHAAVDWKKQLEYWKGCTCVHSIPVDCTSQELVEYYERNCTTCGRNYKHLETGEQE